jgi:hypothetical protein
VQVALSVTRLSVGSGESGVATVSSNGSMKRMCLSSAKARSAGSVSSSISRAVTVSWRPLKLRTNGPTLCGNSSSFFNAR